jgi:hypothetical protein
VLKPPEDWFQISWLIVEETNYDIVASHFAEGIQQSAYSTLKVRGIFWSLIGVQIETLGIRIDDRRQDIPESGIKQLRFPLEWFDLDICLALYSSLSIMAYQVYDIGEVPLLHSLMQCASSRFFLRRPPEKLW